MYGTDRPRMGGARRRTLAAALLALTFVLIARGPAPAPAATPVHADFRPGVVLVGFKAAVAAERRRAITSAYGRRARMIGTVTILRVRRGRELAVVRALRRRAEVRYAEPDYAMRVAATPNDPGFAQQWAPANDGTTAAWNVTTGTTSVVVGELDTGVEYTHPDLAANIWTNPGGVAGCPGGTHGRNVVAATSNCDPMDDDSVYGGHGTHVAGIIGAVGGNAAGVAGVNWTTRILPVKVADTNGWASESGLIEGIDWLVQAKQAGVNIRVVNDSITTVGTPFSQAVSDAIDRLGANGILLVTAAGNTSDDNDDPAVRRYPCGYDRPNELCVAATDQTGRLPSWSNYGDQTVDLAAPGDHIYSTLRGSTYGFVSGTSMASPQVAGAAALVLADTPGLTVTQLRARMLDSVDRLPALDGLVRVGGRLNVCRALPHCSAPANPAPPATFGATAVGGSTGSFDTGRKAANAATLTEAGQLTRLRVFLEPGSAGSGSASLRGLVYADDGGAPGALLGTTAPLSYPANDDRGWFDLNFSSPLALGAGRYWLGVQSGGTANVAGFRWASAAGSRRSNADAYADGAADPFGSAGTDGEQMSLYAVYAPEGASLASASSPATGDSPATTAGAPGGDPSGVPPDAGDHPAGSCPGTSALAGTGATPRGRGLAISIPRGRAVGVDVLRASAGRLHRVARLGTRRDGLTWTAPADGVYVVRLTRAAEERRVVVERRFGRFYIRPRYRATSTCGTIRLFALDAPLVGGRVHRALAISYRLAAKARVEVRVTRARRTVYHSPARSVTAGRVLRLRLGTAAIARGDLRVVLRVTVAGRTITRTLTARRL
jgi:subtilisin family serine protease